MSQLTDRIAAVSRRPATLGQVPQGAVSLAVGEPAGNTPPQIIDAAVKAMHDGRTRYAPMPGTPELRATIAEHLGLPGDATDQVVVTHGAAAGLGALLLGRLNPGDKVVIPEPTYSLYADLVAMAGAEIVWVPPRPDGTIDPDQVAAALPGAAMVILCHPSNPTGQVLSGDVLGGLIETSQAEGVLCVVDEAYRDIVFTDDFTSSAGYLASHDQVVLVGTFSKTFAMTGWRLGYVAGAPQVVADTGLAHRTFNGAVTMFAQDAAATAFDLLDDIVPPMRAHYQKNLDLVRKAMDGLGDLASMAVPGGAFYAFPKVHVDASSDDLVAQMTDAGVLVRSGREFGPSGEGFLRLSFSGSSEDVAEGLRRFSAVVRAAA